MICGIQADRATCNADAV